MTTLFSDDQLALLVHDLNNGLTVAQAGVELATGIDRELNSDTRHALGDAQVALERMRVMLKQFLDTYQFEDGSVALVRRPAVLGDVIDQAARVISHAGRRYRVEIDASRDRCTVDLGLIDRAIANLLLNAARYVDRDGLVRVCARVVAGEVIIDVGNTGEPPEEELIPRLFDKFAVGETGQHGLGLYFCRLVSEAHGGRVQFAPLAGMPTNFRLRFPA